MPDPTKIANWHRIDDLVTTSRQPTEDQLADIQALGVQKRSSYSSRSEISTDFAGTI